MKKITTMNKNNIIQEEHIVAYLDGELHAGAEIKSALQSDPELARAAMEHGVMQKIFARTSTDSRFRLTAEADAKALGILKQTISSPIHKTRRSSDARPITRVRPMPFLKTAWFKRSMVGVVAALFLGTIWFSFGNRDTVAPVAAINESKPITTTPQVNEVATTTANPITNQSSNDLKDNTTLTQHSQAVVTSQKYRKSSVTDAANSSASANAVGSEPSKDLAVSSPSSVSDQQTDDPADVMISHRYAKLIKHTRVVEVTAQDRM